jgi:hypothetical protein
VTIRNDAEATTLACPDIVMRLRGRIATWHLLVDQSSP